MLASNTLQDIDMSKIKNLERLELLQKEGKKTGDEAVPVIDSDAEDLEEEDLEEEDDYAVDYYDEDLDAFGSDNEAD